MPQMRVASGSALRMFTICAVKSVASGANFSTATPDARRLADLGEHLGDALAEAGRVAGERDLL